MDLISPKFIDKCDNKRVQILRVLFEKEEIFSIVMKTKNLSFIDACSWIAKEVFETDLPLASPSEVELLKLAPKEMVSKIKKDL